MKDFFKTLGGCIVYILLLPLIWLGVFAYLQAEKAERDENKDSFYK